MMLGKVTAEPRDLLEEQAVSTLPLNQGNELVQVIGDDAVCEHKYSRCEEDHNDEDKVLDEAEHQRFLISRTKIQMSQNPQVMKTMKQSQRKLAKP